MVLADVSVLVYAQREDTEHHLACRRWLAAAINGEERYGVSELVLSGFVRVTTHPRVFASPSPVMAALEFAEQVRQQPNAMLIEPGERHWSIFRHLCMEGKAKGKAGSRRLLRRYGDRRGRLRVDHDRPGRQPLSRTALANSAPGAPAQPRFNLKAPQ